MDVIPQLFALVGQEQEGPAGVKRGGLCVMQSCLDCELDCDWSKLQFPTAAASAPSDISGPRRAI